MINSDCFNSLLTLLFIVLLTYPYYHFVDIANHHTYIQNEQSSMY